MKFLETLTIRRAAWLSAAIAVLVYFNAPLNAFAGDDVLVVLQNDRVHSAGSALSHWFSSYWPPPWEAAGLYRPLTILSYGIDWSLSGGRSWLFHVNNVLLHGIATFLAVSVAARWLPPLGALVTGAVFAVHPVHVEAVANVVGRAELLAAVGVLATVLAARRARHAENASSEGVWLAAGAASLLLGLFSKEHAVIGIAVVALDQLLDPRPARRATGNVYLALGAVTVGWLFLWRAIAGGLVTTGANTAFYGIPGSERIATMMTVQLQLLRLLFWPLDVTADYSQQTTSIATWGPVALLGALSAVALLGIGVAAARRAPAVAFAILVAVASYAPVSNILFVSGVVLAERALYLAALVPAVMLGWAAGRIASRPERRYLAGAMAVYLAVLSVRTVTRTPYWKSATNTIVEDIVEHPENYRVRIHMGGIYLNARDTTRALAEYLAAAALAENDPFTGQFTVRNAIALGRPRLAVLEGERVHALAPHDPRTGRWLLQAYSAARLYDTAIAVARRDAVQWPTSVGLARTFRLALESAEAPPWRLLLAGASDDWLSGRLVQGTARLDSLDRLLQQAVGEPSFCEDFRAAETAVRMLRPSIQDRARSMASSTGPCKMNESIRE